MKTLRHQVSKILRSHRNTHHFICFLNGKIRIFSTVVEDINSQVAELFGALNTTRRADMSRMAVMALLFAGVIDILPSAALAIDPLSLPTGYQSVSGNVHFTQTPGILNVTTDANRSVVNYHTFDLGSHASVNFNLPNANASILNRVIGGNLSEIYGNISSNGKVFLVNPAGIFFGNGANISVSGLVASTLNITDNKFLNGQYDFIRVSGALPTGVQIGKDANIKLLNGGVASFLGSYFINNGNIGASGGAIQIGVGDRITLGGDLIGLTVNEPLKAALNQVAVVNTGNMSAEQVKILASFLKDNVHSAIINNSGHISANKLIDGDGGTIELIAENGLVNNTGTIDASGIQGGQISLAGSMSQNASQLLANGTQGHGGTVQVLGTDLVALTGNAIINASGQTGGGTVLVGGDARGQSDSVTTAANTYIGPHTYIQANALTAGNGGKVIVWGNNVTDYLGTISAKGGILAGSGGFVETSGKNYLDMQGQVDASAPRGLAGSWLLDPLNVSITNSTNNILPVFDPITNTVTGIPVAVLPGNSRVNASLISAALNNGTNVTINTGLTGVDTGNITVDSTISKTAGSNATLSLLAANNIDINQTISSTNGKLNLVLQADHDISSAPTADGVGAMNLNAAVTTNNGDVTLNGAAITLNGNLNAGMGELSATAANGGIIQTAGNIKADTVTLSATGGNILQTGGTLSTMTLNATTGSTGSTITLADTDVNQANLSSNNGNVNLTDRDGLNVNVQVGSGTATITADAGSILLHSNNGMAGSGINLTGNNNAATLNLLTYHGGISQDGGSTVAGTTLNAESKDPAHNGIALNDADFTTATFKTNNGLVNYQDKDGVAVSVQAGSGNVNITTSASWLVSDNGKIENDLVITGTNTANNLHYTALNGNIRQDVGMANVTNLTAQAITGDIIQNGGALNAASQIELLTSTGSIVLNGGSMGATTLHLFTDSGNITRTNGTVDVLSAMLATNSGNITLGGGTLNAVNAVLSTNTVGNITINNGLLRADQVGINTNTGTITQNGGTVEGGVSLDVTSSTGTISQNNGTLEGGIVNLFTNSGNILRNNGLIDSVTAVLGSHSGNITYNDGQLHANTARLANDTTGNIVMNGGEISATNVALNTIAGKISQNGGLLQGGNLLELTSASGDVIQNAGSMSATTAHWFTDSGAIIRNNGLLDVVNATLATDTGHISYNNGSLLGVNVSLLANNNSAITQNGGTINAQNVNFFSQTGDITQNGGTIQAGQTATFNSNGGNIIQNNGSLTGDQLNIASNNGNIGLFGSSTANTAIRLTTSNTLPSPAGQIQIGSLGNVFAPLGSVYINTNNLLLDGKVNGKIVQIWPWDLNLGMSIGTLTSGGLTLGQTLLSHINTEPMLGLNTVMFGHQNYTGTITLGTVDFSIHPLSDIVFNTPHIFDETPNTDPSGNFNLRMANNRSVFFTAGANTPADWNMAIGGLSFGDNASLRGDLDVAVSGTGTINVNISGSPATNAPSFAIVNGNGSKAFINVSAPAQSLVFSTSDNGVATFRNLPSLQNPSPETQILNQIKGNTITLPGSRIINHTNVYGLQAPVPFITNITL